MSYKVGAVFGLVQILTEKENSTTGADASGKYQLAGIHKFINALTTHSELLSYPPSSAAECSYANTEAKQVLISWA